MKSFYGCVEKNKFGLVQDGRSAANRFSPFGSIFTISDEYPGSGGGLWRSAFLHSSRRCGTYRRAGGRRFCTGPGGFRIPDPGFCRRGSGWRCIRTWFCRCLLHSFHGAGIFCRFLWMCPLFFPSLFFNRKRAASIAGHPFGIAGIAPRFSRGFYFSAICSTLHAGMVNLIPACTFSTSSNGCTVTFSGSSKVFFACISWVTI